MQNYSLLERQARVAAMISHVPGERNWPPRRRGTPNREPRRARNPHACAWLEWDEE